jgi:hypothetical protein
MAMESGTLGKKVFFLYPPPVLTEVADSLARQEYEVYLVNDHERLGRAIANFPDAIVFINIDNGLDEPGWQAYVHALRERCPTIGIGVVTLNDNPELREQYLMDLEVPCGFVVLKIGASKTSEILAKTLEANEARGKRKFVRAICPPGSAQAAIDWDGTTLRASIGDMSSAGMAILFEDGATLPVGTVLRGISLTIKGQRLGLAGIVVARRGGPGPSTHVVMFDPSSLNDDRRDKLKSIVYKINQAAMDSLLERS